ncbi:DUF4199 domain-containing protein [Aquimarina sp. D1M17]|uniref:DUF4199 domain-containing protein n=1 Tax=Aquimarina acroporae TaxID=2937283 RepID=UPI0020BFAEB6|nr:DUF4199 domain-containing protein [Aquimarina acroporae]MCK8520819.1 DUF4199 domain-containing protein [Aquimarina acroporae]
MTNQIASIYKHILIYGLIYGCIWFSYRAIIYLIFNSLSAPKQWNTEAIIIELFIYISGITYTMYAYKENNSGYLKLLDALKIGIFMGIFQFIFSQIWYLLYTDIIHPDYLSTVLERNRETKMLKNPELSAKEIDQITSAARSKFDFKIKLYTLIINISFSSFIASIAGAIMHEKKKL